MATVAPSVLTLPIIGMKSAPEKFTGEHSYVRPFLEHYERLCTHNNVTTDAEKLHSILQYCSIRVQEIIQGMPHYFTLNWDAFKRDLLKHFDADFSDQRFQETDLKRFVLESMDTPISSLHDFRAYNRDFIHIGGWLMNKGKISEGNYNRYFWIGLPHSFRSVVDARLLLKDPRLDVSIPYAYAEVCKVAEELLHCDRFDLEDMEFLGIKLPLEPRKNTPISDHCDPRDDPIWPLLSPLEAKANLKALDQERATVKGKDDVETLIHKLSRHDKTFQAWQ